MNKLLNLTEKPKQILDSPLEMPASLAVGAGLLAASPLGLTFIFNTGPALPVNLVTLLSFVNSLILEHYFYRAVMMVGYVIQYRAKVIAALPLALQIITEALTRIMRVLFNWPESLFRQTEKRVIKTADMLKISSPRTINNGSAEIGGRLQRRLLVIWHTDDFLCPVRCQLPV
jgi:hypothetical protein